MSSDDSEVTASPIPFDETACGFLDPIGELDLASRRKLLEKSRRLSLRSGEVLLAKDYPWSMLFLLGGTANQTRPKSFYFTIVCCPRAASGDGDGAQR
jgi:hypothetical protein